VGWRSGSALHSFGRFSVRISTGTPDILTEVYRGFPEIRDSIWIRPVPLPSESFPSFIYPTILRIDSVVG
jgi:hypothetical protein